MPTWWERGGEMPTIEERVAYLEGTVGEHARGFSDLQQSIADVRSTIADVRSSVTDLRADMNARFAQVDRRFEQIDHRFDQVDARFMWMFGTQLAVLLSVIAALAGAYYR